jgi:hypothetical protein
LISFIILNSTFIPQILRTMTGKEVSGAEKSVIVGEKEVDAASTTPSSTWKGWLWDSVDVSKEERRFLLKVGCFAWLSITEESVI